MTPIQTLTDLLAHHESAAAALRITLGLLGAAPTTNGHGTNGHAAQLRAVAIDTILQTKAPRAAPATKKRRGAGVRAALKRRARTAAMLATLDVAKPRPIDHSHGIGPLIRMGYIKRRGDGFIRTAKPFLIDYRTQL